MVGGEVIEIIPTDDRVWINCRGRGCERKQTCAIYVERDAKSALVEVGDSLWWQGGRAMWTPKRTRDQGNGPADIVLTRAGCSGAHHPYVSALVEEIKGV